MDMIYFEEENVKLEKLKEWKILSPKAEIIKKFVYKSEDGITTECEIIGYKTKTTNPKCINEIYENLVIEFYTNTDVATIKDINIEYFKSMQRKNFKFNEEEE